MPRVSVLMSIYRPDERYLAEQLETIDSQDFDDFEVVVYNDCPEDDQWEDFCRSHVVSHPLRYVCGEVNLGYIKAFERLVTLAEGEYIAFSDQDDRWLPGRLSRGVEVLDQGHVMVNCDRQIIDPEDRVVVQSWRESHPDDASGTWHTGDEITSKAAFSCYSMGMATMMRTDAAQSLVPFPDWVGHDKWLALGASALGSCASIEEPLVQHRRHGKNESGALHRVSCKQDWYESRVQGNFDLVKVFAERFPDNPALPVMWEFAEARLRRDLRGIWRHRDLAPQIARFEIALCLVPDPIFKLALALYRRRSN